MNMEKSLLSQDIYNTLQSSSILFEKKKKGTIPYSQYVMYVWGELSLYRTKFSFVLKSSSTCAYLHLSSAYSNSGLYKSTVNAHRNIPPVHVELSVSKAQQLSYEVQRGVKEPVEKHQPQQVIRNLEKGWRNLELIGQNKIQYISVRHLQKRPPYLTTRPDSKLVSYSCSQYSPSEI